MKQVFSLQVICELINIQIKGYSVEEAYDYFCDEIEKAIKAVFITRDFSYASMVDNNIKESKMLKSAVLSFAHKLYVERFFLSDDNDKKDK